MYRRTQFHSSVAPASGGAGAGCVVREHFNREASTTELWIKALIAALFLPEGLSFFIGDFRLSLARVLIIILTGTAIVRFLQSTNRSVTVPSDVFAIMTGLWMIIAPSITDGGDGLKGGGMLALEFSGAYLIFRNLLSARDSAVRVVFFLCTMIVVIVPLAVLDPLSDRLVVYETVRGLTGYSKGAFDWAKQVHSETMYRHGLVRAMGPLEHSILFGAACAWLGTIAACTFSPKPFGILIAVVACVGIAASQAQGPLVAYALSLSLMFYYFITKRMVTRWKIIGIIFCACLGFIFLFSANPVATLLGLGGVNPETGWYRQAIWQAVTPFVMEKPIFGMGLSEEWDWQSSGALVGASVDAMWLRLAMMLGIPGTLLVFLTMTGSYLLGSIDRSSFLSHAERRLSVGLGLATVAAIFLGFTVHIWGTCWVLLGAFAGMRGGLAAAHKLRGKAFAPLNSGMTHGAAASLKLPQDISIVSGFRHWRRGDPTGRTSSVARSIRA